MRQDSAVQAPASTFSERFGMVGLHSVAKQITATLIGARVKGIGHREPRDSSLANLRADVRSGKQVPVRTLLRLAFSDIEDGVSVQLVTQYLREIIEKVEQYAARRERRAGILSFTDALRRKLVHGEREECEAKVSLLGVADDIASIDAAIAELNQEIAADQETVALLTAEKVRRLEAQR